MIQTARVLIRMAWRNLWRNHRRTLVMLAAISVGVWAMIFMTALMRGMIDDMVDGAVKSFLGHGQLHHPLYADDPSIDNRFAPPDGPLLARLNRAPILAWAARVRLPAVIASERESTGVLLMGIDPQREMALSFVDEHMSEGRFLTDATDTGLIIGAALAKQLDTDLGKRLVIMSQSVDNQVADRGFRVVGIYRAKLPELEKRFVIVGLTTAQQLLGLGEAITEIEWQTDRLDNANPLARELALLAPTLSSQSWRELDPYLGSMTEVMDGFVLVWILIVFTALSFGLVNTLAMAVFERVREFGLMKALGLKPSAIVALVLAESFFLIALGLLLGNLFAVGTLAALHDGIDISKVAQGMAMMGASSLLRPALSLGDMVLANVVVLCLSLCASCLPAWRAARFHPVDALSRT